MMSKCILFLLISVSFTVQAGGFGKFKKRVIDIDGADFVPGKRWYRSSENAQEKIDKLLQILSESRTGQKLMSQASAKAAKEGKTINELFKVGEGSLLDTTLVRRFSQNDPSVIQYETRSTIFINKTHSYYNAVLDMAHELTHYTFRKAFNPYVDNFDPGEFVRSTVEGTGGEVEAYLVECKVMYELFPSRTSKNSNCGMVKNPETGKLSKALAVEQFYRVGGHIRSYEKDMDVYNISKTEFPYLSSGEATFISSAWGLPYPVAALKEYKTIMGKVCQNDQKRLVLMQKNLGRLPASESTSPMQRQYKTFFSSYRNRCEKFM
jgi:hypothetical protein